LESCNEDSEYDGLNNVLKNLFDIYWNCKSVKKRHSLW
jgi:hypothetical protein